MVSAHLIFILILFIANGLFAMSELAIVSARKVRLQQWANDGNKRARKALELSNSPSHFLSTIQIGITLVGILSGVFGGATLARHLERYMEAHLPIFGEYTESASVVFVVICLTYFSILIGELVPKRLALQSPERIAVMMVGPMVFISQVAAPFVKILSLSTDWILKIFGISNRRDDPPVTEEEIITLVEQGTLAGVFHHSEKELVERVLAFGDKKVSSIMTPRPDIVWLDINEDYETNRQKMKEAPHAQFPVARDNLDHLIGTVHTKELYCHEVQGQQRMLDLIYQPLYVPATNGALHVLEMFKETGIHLGFVIDEYGSIQGIVTLTDILEALVGDLPSNLDEDTQVIQRDDGSWLIDGMLPLEEFKKQFAVEDIPGADKGNFQTIAGFIMSFLGRVPIPTDNFEWNGLKFEVIDMDANRIDKILITKVDPQ